MTACHGVGSATLLAFVLSAGTAFATVIPGGTLITQTWTPAGSPYEVMGDITIPAGATLTIEAGTVVRFATADAQGAGVDVARVEVIVEGTLDVNGTSGSPVAFETMGAPGTMNWYGIRVRPGAASCDLANFTLRHATLGVQHEGAASVLALANADFNSNNQDLSTIAGGAIAFSGKFRASRMVGPLTIPAGVRFEHNGVPGGTVGALTMEPGSTYAASVRGQSDTDRLFTVSPITLAGALDLDVSACVLTLGQQTVLFANNSPDPVSGAFDSHPEGSFVPFDATLDLRVSYVMFTGNDIGLTAESAADVGPGTPPGNALRLLAARPNPATGRQRFAIEVPSLAGAAMFEVVDLAGRRVWSDAVAPGVTEIAWDGRDEAARAVAPGVYLARLTASGLRASALRFVRIR